MLTESVIQWRKKEDKTEDAKKSEWCTDESRTKEDDALMEVGLQRAGGGMLWGVLWRKPARYRLKHFWEPEWTPQRRAKTDLMRQKISLNLKVRISSRRVVLTTDRRSFGSTDRHDLFQENGLNSHDKARNRNVRWEALADYGELVKNRSKTCFVGSNESRQNWDATVF